jgi:hypothetical protein
MRGIAEDVQNPTPIHAKKDGVGSAMWTESVWLGPDGWPDRIDCVANVLSAEGCHVGRQIIELGAHALQVMVMSIAEELAVFEKKLTLSSGGNCEQ